MNSGDFLQELEAKMLLATQQALRLFDEPTTEMNEIEFRHVLTGVQKRFGPPLYVTRRWLKNTR